MILVDTSVWIDFLNGVETWQSLRVRDGFGSYQFVVGDLILTEVLQGSRSDRQFEERWALLSRLPLVEIGGTDVAVQAARNYRLLRDRGRTVRKTIDTLIATRCILDRLTLLHNDREFDPFALHLGLRVASRQ